MRTLTASEALSISSYLLPSAYYEEEEACWIGGTAWDLLRQAKRCKLSCKDVGGTSVRVTWDGGEGVVP
jgi:hypothetical protein